MAAFCAGVKGVVGCSIRVAAASVENLKLVDLSRSGALGRRDNDLLFLSSCGPVGAFIAKDTDAFAGLSGADVVSNEDEHEPREVEVVPPLET